MKPIYIILILLYSNSVFAQDKVDLTCFTLGLVDDYLGRTLVKADRLESIKIDKFHETQTGIMDLLDSLINEENKSRDKEHQITKKRIRATEPNCTSCNEFFKYYSKELSTELNKKYKLRFSHDWDLKERKIYNGRIKISHFKNDSQRISFLSGAYVRSGTKEGDVFVYNLANSVEQFNLIVKSLKKLNCDIKDIKVEGGTPASQKVYFIPSDKLKLELGKYEGMKKKMAMKRHLFFKA